MCGACPTPDEAQLQALLAAARAAREQAYAPYSHFKVGAAVLDLQGRIHAGCNVVNAAYPQGLCSEANDLAHMVMAGGRQVQAVAVVIAADLEKVRGRYVMGELLPFGFGPGQLG